MTLNALTNDSGLAIVNDMNASDGSIVLWRMGGAVRHDVLADEWTKRGLDPRYLLPPTSRAAALRRACYAFQSRDTIIKKVSADDSRGFKAFVRQTDGGREGFMLAWTATLGANHAHPEVVFADGLPDPDVEDQIVLSYQRELNELSHHEVSAWLVGLTEMCRAVSLRDTGGIYFIPRDGLPFWREAVAALNARTECAAYEIPAVTGAQATTAVMDALTREAAAQVDVLSDALAAGVQGPRALKSRAADAERMEQKLAAYEELLGTKLETLRSQFTVLQAKLSQAALVTAEPA